MVSKKQGIEQLGQVPLFNGLSSKDLGRIWESMKIVKHPEGKEIIREGHKGIGFHLILSGTVRVSRAVGGRAIVLGPNDAFGEMALIDNVPRSADAKADKNGAIVLSIRKEVFNKLLNIEKVSSTRLLGVLCHLIGRRLRDSHEKIVGWYILSGGAHTLG